MKSLFFSFLRPVRPWFPLGLHANADPRLAAVSSSAQVESQSGDTFIGAFLGHKTGRRESWIVKVTQSAAKVVTGVSVSLSCAVVRHKIKEWITQRLLHVVQMEPHRWFLCRVAPLCEHVAANFKMSNKWELYDIYTYECHLYIFNVLYFTCCNSCCSFHRSTL